MTDKPALSDEQAALRKAANLIGLLWHVGVFVIINAFLWILDLSLGQDGVQWAYWVTGFWGLGLLFHLLAWFIDGQQLERRLAQHYLDKQRRSAH